MTRDGCNLELAPIMSGVTGLRAAGLLAHALLAVYLLGKSLPLAWPRSAVLEVYVTGVPGLHDLYGGEPPGASRGCYLAGPSSQVPSASNCCVGVPGRPMASSRASSSAHSSAVTGCRAARRHASSRPISSPHLLILDLIDPGTRSVQIERSSGAAGGSSVRDDCAKKPMPPHLCVCP
jgi:hypothetical protein